MLFNIIESFSDENLNILILLLNIFTLLALISSFIFVRDSRKRWNKVTDYLGDVTKTVNSVRYGNLTKKINLLEGYKLILLGTNTLIAKTSNEKLKSNYR